MKNRTNKKAVVVDEKGTDSAKVVAGATGGPGVMMVARRLGALEMPEGGGGHSGGGDSGAGESGRADSGADDGIGGGGLLALVCGVTRAKKGVKGGEPGAVGTAGGIGGAECFEGSAAISAAEAQTLELSPAQRKAIELLTTGHTLVAAARAAGVGRTTLYRWFKNDAAFVSAYNAWQRDVVETARRRILALGELATSVVAKAMLRGDAVTAREVLKSIGAMEREVKPIAVEPERAGRWLKVEGAKNEIVLKGAEDEVVLKEMGID